MCSCEYVQGGQEGYAGLDLRWTVRLDVRDLGGHLDTTFRGWSATLSCRVGVVFLV